MEREPLHLETWILVSSICKMRIKAEAKSGKVGKHVEKEN
jgi:hypothetical protein